MFEIRNKDVILCVTNTRVILHQTATYEVIQELMFFIGKIYCLIPNKRSPQNGIFVRSFDKSINKKHIMIAMIKKTPNSNHLFSIIGIIEGKIPKNKICRR